LMLIGASKIISNNIYLNAFEQGNNHERTTILIVGIRHVGSTACT